jgi:hypothetical protein
VVRIELHKEFLVPAALFPNGPGAAGWVQIPNVVRHVAGRPSVVYGTVIGVEPNGDVLVETQEPVEVLVAVPPAKGAKA